MFISKKKVRAIEEKLDNRTHVADFKFWQREVIELKAKMAALEDLLGLYYTTTPQKSSYVEKGGPEREAR